VRQSELAFEKRGPLALVGARFIPGVSLLAPPLAGGLGMPLPTFAFYHGTAAMLYAGAGIGSGLLFYDQLRVVLSWLSEHGPVAVMAAVLLTGAWLARKF
jgi:membrane protein DedA with SNARE-associated domain